MSNHAFAIAPHSVCFSALQLIILTVCSCHSLAENLAVAPDVTLNQRLIFIKTSSSLLPHLLCLTLHSIHFTHTYLEYCRRGKCLRSFKSAGDLGGNEANPGCPVLIANFSSHHPWLPYLVSQPPLPAVFYIILMYYVISSIFLFLDLFLLSLSTGICALQRQGSLSVLFINLLHLSKMGARAVPRKEQ